jgi:manganese efflux pump family protein
MALAALACWLLAGAAGIYMFGTWLSSGGPGHQRSRRDGLPPAVLLTHLGFGALGLVAWVGYLLTGQDWLAWTGVGLLMPGIGLGICTVTLWAPYPTSPGPGAPVTGDAGPGGAGPASGMLAAPPENAIGDRLTDEGLARALSSEAQASKLINEALASLPEQEAPARKSRRHLAPLIPAGHGIAAVATFVLAVTTAISAR